MLERIFLEVLEMSLSASIVILLVIPVRLALKRFPKMISYMLWSVVFFRLLCPFAIRFEFSPIPDMDATVQEWVYGDVEQAVSMQLSGSAAPGNPVEGKELFLVIGENVWFVGVLLLFGYCVISFLGIRKRVETAIRYKENIYMTEKISSPFVMGLLRPRIFLPMELDEQELEYVILHEQLHIRRFDHVAKLLGFAAACIHWFNPMAWIAFLLFCNDMEMSCDEAVIGRMGEGIRAEYSTTLLSVSANLRFPSGIPVDFGEGNVKERIRNMQRYKKVKKVTLVILIAAVAVLCLGLLPTRTTTLANLIKEDEQEPMTAASQEQENSVFSGQETEGNVLEPYLRILARLNEEWGTSYAFDPDKTYDEIVQFVTSMNEEEFEQHICELHELDMSDPLYGETELYYGFP